MLRISSLFISAALLAGCAAPQIAEIDNLSTLTSQVADKLGNDSDKALKSAQQAYETAQDEQLNFYAPLHMQRIEAAMKDVQRNDLTGDDSALIHSSALLQTLLQTALQNKHEVQTSLGQLLAQRDVLLSIHANNALPGDYNDVMEDLTDLITLIEAGQKEKAVKKSSGVLQDLNDLEPDAMLAIHWQPAYETLDKADDEDADDNAPVTFRQAEEKVKNARLTIKENYKDRQMSQTAGLEALRAAQHALYVGRAAEKLQRLTAEQAEQKALDFENYLHDISVAMATDDLRHMDLRDQALAIIQSIQEREREFRQELIAAGGNSPEATAPAEEKTAPAAQLPADREDMETDAADAQHMLVAEPPSAGLKAMPEAAQETIKQTAEQTTAPETAAVKAEKTEAAASEKSEPAETESNDGKAAETAAISPEKAEENSAAGAGGQNSASSSYSGALTEQN